MRGKTLSDCPSGKTFCWIPTWNARREGVGLEHLLLSERCADSVVLAFDDNGAPFRLSYRLEWDEGFGLRSAELVTVSERATNTLSLGTNGKGRWWGNEGEPIGTLDGCIDIDIWPTPFTNSFPIWREPLAIGERREFLMAWVFGPTLAVTPLPQAYTRIAQHRYLYESLGGSGFRAELTVDEEGVVVDYEGLFRRVMAE